MNLANQQRDLALESSLDEVFWRWRRLLFLMLRSIGLENSCFPTNSYFRVGTRKSGCSQNSRVSQLEIRLPTSMERYFLLRNS